MMNVDTNTMKRQEGDYTSNILYVFSYLFSKQHQTESSYTDDQKTASLTIQSIHDINLNLSDIIALYQQIDNQLFDHKPCHKFIPCEKVMHDNMDEILSQRIILQINKQSTVLQGFIEGKQQQLVVQKKIKVDCSTLMIQKLDEYKIHHKINQILPQQSIELFIPVIISKQKQLYKLISYIERAKFNLYDYAQKYTVTADQAFHIFRNILFQIIKLHEMKIAHRDVKPQNILYVEQKGWLLSDFGESQEYLQLEDDYNIRGTKYFLSNNLKQLITANKKVQQNLLKNDLYALAVTIIMIQNNEYIEDITNELQKPQFSKSYLLYILQIDSLQQLQQYYQNIHIEPISVEFNLQNSIYKQMSQVEQVRNKKLIKQSFSLLRIYYEKNKINMELLQYINKYHFTLIDHAKLITVARAMKKENIKMIEQTISLLYTYGYNEKLIYYSKQTLQQIYSQTIHITLVLSYQRSNLLQEAEEEFKKFNQNLLFDPLETILHQKYIFVLNEYQKQKDSQINEIDLNIQDLLAPADIQLNVINNQLTQELIVQIVNQTYDRENIIQLFVEVLKQYNQQFFNKKKYKEFLRTKVFLIDFLPLEMYCKILDSLSNKASQLIDLNDTMESAYQLCEASIFLKETYRYQKRYKQLQKLILISDSWQQIASFKIYQVQIKLHLLKGDDSGIQKLLNKLRNILKDVHKITFKRYYPFIQKNLLLFLLGRIYQNARYEQFPNIIYLIQSSLLIATYQSYHMKQQDVFKKFHILAQHMLLSQRNNKRQALLVKQFKNIITKDVKQDRQEYFKYKYNINYENEKIKSFMLEQYLQRL